ncbi:MAG: hypothetical protein KKD86_09540 [Bacteroidetes bacterium]|nr:hypothetical protein [Bacteroidota bacterium]
MTNSKFILFIRANLFQITFILLSAGLSILLAGIIDIENPDYSHMDFNKYRSMSLASPGISDNIIQPFAYRFLMPWLAGLFSSNVDTSFVWLNLIGLLALVLLLYYYLIKEGAEKDVSAVIVISFIFNRYFFKMLAWIPYQLADTYSLLIIIFLLLLLKNKKWLLISFLLMVGIAVKETVLIIIPVAYLYCFQNGKDYKSILHFTVASFPAVIIFVLLRVSVHTAESESFFEQFITGIPLFVSPELIIKKLFLAFTPLGFVPFLFFTSLKDFTVKHAHLVLLFILVFISSVMGNFERVMLPAAPAFCLFASLAISKELNVVKSKTRTYILLLIILSSVLSSFYHLYGIILLPNKDISLISAVVFNLAVLIVIKSRLIIEHG